jgi:5-aminolevulinate synthase
LPPAIAAAATQSVRLAKTRPDLRMAHQRQAWLTKHALMLAGLPVLENPSHIVPVMVRDAHLCKSATDMLLSRHGIYIQPINYPTVPRGAERLRITPTPYHGDAHIAHLVEALVDVWKTLRIPFVEPKKIEAPFANDAVCTYPEMKRAAE